MTYVERLPEPSLVESPEERQYFEQLIRVLRINYDILEELYEGLSLKKTVGCQVTNAGSPSIATQVDGLSDDAIAAVASVGTGQVLVSFKEGYFTQTPVVTVVPYGSGNTAYLCSVNSVTTASATIYTFLPNTTATDFDFSLMAFGV